MQVQVYDRNGNPLETREVSEYIFGEEINIGLMHQAYVRQMANARQGTQKAKSRSEVRGSTAKIYRQKGTGRARHGARTAPIFVGGGRAHPPRPRKYTKAMPKKMRRKAIRSALSALMRDEQLVFVDALQLDAPKTREMTEVIQALTGGNSALVLFTDGQENVQRSVSNMKRSLALRANYLNIRDLLKYDKVIVPWNVLDVIEGIWGQQRTEVANG
jgi:large subunit ribosomal protein L4